MFEFFCPKCKNTLFSASDHRYEEKIYCSRCNTYLDNPYYKKPPN